MSDIADKARHIEQRERDAAIAQARAKPQEPPQELDGDTIVCACCGHPIPLKRLEKVPDATLCVECKSLLEAM